MLRASVDVGVAKIRLTGGEPLLRVGIETLIEMLSALPVDLTLTTNASRAAEEGAGAQGRRPQAHHGQPRLARRRHLQVDERRRLPRLARARGHRGGAGGRDAGQGQLRRQARHERAADRRARAALPRHRRHAPLHRVHGRRRDERLAHGRRRPRRRDRRDRSTRSSASSRSTRSTAARSPSAGSYKDGSGEIGVIASVTQPFCGDCTRSRLSAEGKLYTCLFAVRGHDLRALIRERRDRRRDRRQAGRDLARPRRPLLRAPRQEHRRPCIGERKVEMSYIGG